MVVRFEVSVWSIPGYMEVQRQWPGRTLEDRHQFTTEESSPLFGVLSMAAAGSRPLNVRPPSMPRPEESASAEAAAPATAEPRPGSASVDIEGVTSASLSSQPSSLGGLGVAGVAGLFSGPGSEFVLDPGRACAEPNDERSEDMSGNVSQSDWYRCRRFNMLVDAAVVCVDWRAVYE